MSTDAFSTASERDALCSFLDQARDALIRKVDGLSDEDARRASTVSSLSLLSLLKHSAIWEHRWFQDVFAGAALRTSGSGQRRRTRLIRDPSVSEATGAASKSSSDRSYRARR